MNASVPEPSAQAARRNPALAILWGGLVAGSLDVGAAALIYHVRVPVVLHSIAGGLLGKAAHQGGMATAWLGLGLQWAMSLLIAAIFVAAALRLDWMWRRPWWSGLAYGVVVFLVMNYIVVPLSAAGPKAPQFTPMLLIWNLLAMLVFGWIIAFAAHRWLGNPGRAALSG